MKKTVLLSFLVLLLEFSIACVPNSKKEAASNIKSSLSNKTPVELESVINDDSNIKISNSLKLVSWNIRDLGKTKNAQEILQIAKIIKDYDIIAIQEVVAKDPGGAQAVAKIVDELNRMGSKWDYRISDPTKSPSAYKSERYAFLWKTSKVKLISKAYLDSELEEKCSREPFIGKFQMNSEREPFYIVNFHSRKYDDHPEEEIVHFKDYPERLKTSRVFIAGDFNLDENHSVWNNFYKIGFDSALKKAKTTLKSKCKKGNYFSHSIDNIYYQTEYIQLIKSGRIDFVMDCDYLEMALYISDHLPVYMEFTINQ